MFVPDIGSCNYADDTTLNVSDTDTIHILHKLESSFSTVASWFTNNCMRLETNVSLWSLVTKATI